MSKEPLILNPDEIQYHEDLVLYLAPKVQLIESMILAGRTNVPLETASRLLCGSTSYLITHWTKSETIGVKGARILQGRRLPSEVMDVHEVVAMETQSGLTMIDSSIWQIKPSVDGFNILGPFKDYESLLQAMSEAYGGDWTVGIDLWSMVSNRQAELNMQLIKLHAQRKDL